MKLYELSIIEAHSLLQKGEISSIELTQSVFDRIESIEDKVCAYITLLHENALKQAQIADSRIKNKDISYLTGIPLAIKDLICTKGIRTTCASKILENYIPPYDATVMKKLNKCGAVTLGKVNMDEFAMGSSTENSAFKKTKNPWNLEYVPGGSSGGSAAAVSADMCIGSLGSDTGGSIRQPASHCSVVGLKPTYGRVSRFGLVAFASSLDQIGPITKNVTDAAILLNAIAGYDKNDSTSVPKDVCDYTQSLKKDIKGMVIGIPEQYLDTEGIDTDVRNSIVESIKILENMGAICKNISLPHSEMAVAAYYIIAPAEASSNLARYDGVKYGLRVDNDDNLINMYKQTRSNGFGQEVIRRIIIGTYALSAGYYDAYYGKASQIRTLIIDDFKKAFKECDIILSPVSPIPPFKINEVIEDPLTMYLADIFTLSANLAGIPAISIPCGFTKNNLPIGLQFMGRHFDEETLIKAAYNFETETEFHKRKPHDI